MTPLLSIIVPCHHCAAECRETLQQIGRVFAGRNDIEIIVVADGNTDVENAMLHAYAARRKNIRCLTSAHRLGKGAAVARGVRAARGGMIAFIDGDRSIDPRYLRSLMSAMQRSHADIIVGNRTRYDTSWMRVVTNRIYRLLNTALFRLPVRDTQAGIKIFSAPVARELFRDLRIKGYAFDIDVLVMAAARGYGIAQAAVRQNREQHSSMTLPAAMHMALDTLGTYHRKIITDVQRTMHGQKHEHADAFSLRHIALYPACMLLLAIAWPLQRMIPREHAHDGATPHRLRLIFSGHR